MDKFYKVDLDGFTAELPILPLPSGISICFFKISYYPHKTHQLL